ncbi:sporulation protein YqfD [Virgibacillus ihumii]|uniref:sporulation protein YqfD n=1 Tax=Virgibacillus ihumii TaxID=2686091 RepID=UPI00157D53D3|nr:sporulation protein YqfD [Virgibacillus ihumii]
MKQMQGSYLTGYVTIKIDGLNPEKFFQACADQGVFVWNIRKESETVCTGNIRLKHLKKMKQIRRKTDFKVSFINKKGLPFILKKLTLRKEILTAFIMSMLLIFFLSNIIWEVRIMNVPTDLEEEISKQLEEYGIHQGAWTFSIDKSSVIQQKLIHDIPELLWVGVHKKGTTFVLEGVEKTIVEEEEKEGPRNLVAAKKGVIQKMYVSKGVPKAQVNDYVEPGDLLVSGKLRFDENKKDKKYELVEAEADIIAKTWYEVSVTIPLEANYELLTGERESKYHLKINGFELPVWGFGSPEFDNTHKERNVNELYFLKWELPVKMVETILSEKEYNKVKRSKAEAIKVGIKQAKNELQLQLGNEARIVSENILHETTENGKVKLILYITVKEDIVKEVPLNQGD